jgi:hypothetical protein
LGSQSVTSRFIATTCSSRSFHSLHSRLTRLRMRGGKVRVYVLEDLRYGC